MKHTKRILIVDDEAGLRVTLALMLKQEGYFVTTTANSKEALFQVSQTSMPKFDLVFLDLRMPGESGIELLPKMRKIMPKKPILILTAVTDPDVLSRAMELGADACLQKPLDPRELLQKTKVYLHDSPSAA